MVTDERGYESLHRDEGAAENYLTHVRGGIKDALVKRDQVLRVIAFGDAADAPDVGGET
jgi:hypothetical protein